MRSRSRIPEGVAWHEVGRGVAIALYTMQPERRGPLDSHIGMMLFKNGIPVGYGGGWPFLGTCRIGVNIFAPFRGGESAFLFGQVLRVYRQRFARRALRRRAVAIRRHQQGRAAVRRILVLLPARLPPDRCAIRRGSPREEWARMQADSGYRTPIPALRRFTRSDIELRVATTCPIASPRA